MQLRTFQECFVLCTEVIKIHLKQTLSLFAQLDPIRHKLDESSYLLKLFFLWHLNSWCRQQEQRHFLFYRRTSMNDKQHQRHKLHQKDQPPALPMGPDGPMVQEPVAPTIAEAQTVQEPVALTPEAPTTQELVPPTTPEAPMGPETPTVPEPVSPTTPEAPAASFPSTCDSQDADKSRKLPRTPNGGWEDQSCLKLALIRVFLMTTLWILN